jgi:hypothetical protein
MGNRKLQLNIQYAFSLLCEIIKALLEISILCYNTECFVKILNVFRV